MDGRGPGAVEGDGCSMSHLSPSQLEELKAELERQLGKLRKSMSVTDKALETVELDQTAVGRLSRMDSLQNQGLAKGLRERESVKLALIQTALKRMQEGSYGRCSVCGGEVPFQRLLIFPESATCSACSG